ncbi:MAG TPA: FkbM family methyltransferase [Anaerolineae bacterium]|nr:FkbM family methyltransferase [Anaerolineae bacterium]
MRLPDGLRRWVRKAGSWGFGRSPRLHRIPFGPNRGLRIFMSFDISPRMWFGIDEPWVAQSAQDHVHPGDVVYDIGAHIGYTCLLYAQRVGDEGAVHAFEILPSITTNYLQKTIQSNAFNNIATHAVGLSDQEEDFSLPVGETLMTSQQSEGREGQRIEECKVVPLDAYAAIHNLPKPTYVKIDIEGAEVRCLLGAEKTFRENLPMMMIEFHSKALLQEGYSLLDAWGYRFVTQRGEAMDEQMIRNLNWFHESVLCLPPSTSAS